MTFCSDIIEQTFSFKPEDSPGELLEYVKFTVQHQMDSFPEKRENRMKARGERGEGGLVYDETTATKVSGLNVILSEARLIKTRVGSPGVEDGGAKVFWHWEFKAEASYDVERYTKRGAGVDGGFESVLHGGHTWAKTSTDFGSTAKFKFSTTPQPE